MNPNKFLISALLVAFVVAQSISQTLTLDQVLEKVERNNPMLAGYKSRAEALEKYAEGATAWMAPMAGIGTFMTPYPALGGHDPEHLDENGELDQGSLMISVEQTIPNKNKLQANKKYMLERSKTEELRRLQQWNELRYEAREAYYIWSLALEKLRKLDETEQILTLLSESASIRVAYNQGPSTAVYRAQARIAEIKNMRSMIEATVTEQQARLATLMNIPEEENFTIQPVTSLQQTLALSDTSSLAVRRSDILGIDQEIKVMKLNQRLQSLQNKPDVRLRFDHMQSYSNMPDQFTAMAMFTIPVAPWSAKMYKAEVAGMSREIEAMKQERSARLLETRGMLNRMSAQIKGMTTQLKRYEEEILPALNRNYDALKIAWEENREQLPMVLDGLEALTMAEQEYLEKKESLFIMTAAYEKLLEN